MVSSTDPMATDGPTPRLSRHTGKALLETATLEVPSIKPDSDGSLYRHVKRPEWGAAILAWERNDTRAYQFEDGQLRKIRKGYYTLLEPIDDFDGPEEAVRTNLERAVTSEDDVARPIQKSVCTFDQQVALFTRLYPKGFEDPDWIDEHRHDADGAALKRHREPSVTDAKEALSAERCATLISENAHEALTDSIIDVLAGTDLVPISHVKTLRKLDEDDKRALAEAAADLLHGERRFEERFGDYLQLLTRFLGDAPSWRVATALPALVHPDEHVSVRRSAFARQAGSIAPTARYSRKAKVSSYRNFRRVAIGVKERLEAAGHEPRDMLDVHDFVWTTLRNSSLDDLGAKA
jgi:hypothetical protein